MKRLWLLGTLLASIGTAYAQPVGPMDYRALGTPNGPAQLDSSSTLSGNSVTATGSTTARTLAGRAADTLNAKDSGAVENGTTDDSTALATVIALAHGNVAPAAKSVTIDSPLFLASPNTISVPSDVQLIFRGTGSLISAFGALNSIRIGHPGSYTACPTVSVSGSATLGTITCSLVAGATLGAGGAGYVPYDVLTLVGGTSTTAAQVRVVNTTVTALPTITAAGTAGTTGSCTVTGTTGSGINGALGRASFSVTISGGGISAVNSIVSGGAYLTNPTAPAAEPVSGCGLVGAQLNLSMAAGAIEAATIGSYTATPSGTITTTGGTGTGATLSASAWGLATVAVSLAGSYPTTTLPTFTITGTATTPAVLLPLGQGPTINGSILAADGAAIFGGAGYIYGTPAVVNFPVGWWGVRFDGATDNTVAFQSAFNAAMTLTRGVELRMPQGVGKISNTIYAQLTGVNALTVTGAASDTTEFDQTADADGLRVTYNSAGWWLRNGNTGVASQFRDFSMVMTAASATARSAITVVGDAIVGRPAPKTLFRNVDIHDLHTGAWLLGFNLQNLAYSFFDTDACTFSFSNANGTCISLNNPAYAPSLDIMTINSLSQTYGQYGINIQGYVEGVQITNSNIVNPVVAINWASNNLQSDLQVTNSYMNGSTAAIAVTDLSWMTFTGNVFASPLNLTCAQMFTATGNVFVGTGSAINLTANGCGGNGQPITITGNTFHGPTTGVANSDLAIKNVLIDGNSFQGVTTPYSVLPAANQIGNNISGNTPSGVNVGGVTNLGTSNTFALNAITFGLIVGNSNTLINSDETCLGLGNTCGSASGAAGASIGFQNVQSGNHSVVLGSGGYDNIHFGTVVLSSRNVLSQGDTQQEFQSWGATTTSTAAVRLTGDGAAAGSLNCFNPHVPNGMLNVEIQINALDKTTLANSGSWTLPIGQLLVGSTVATTTWTGGTPVTLGTAFTVATSADTTNGCLNLTITPPSSDTYQWTAGIHATDTR